MSPAELPRHPRLGSSARLRLDRRTGKVLLLSPERGLLLNESAAAIVRLCDGRHSVAEIVESFLPLGAEPGQVEAEVLRLLTELHRRGLLGPEPEP